MADGEPTDSSSRAPTTKGWGMTGWALREIPISFAVQREGMVERAERGAGEVSFRSRSLRALVMGDGGAIKMTHKSAMLRDYSLR